MAKPVRVEYESKIGVGATNTGLILLFGGLGVLGFGYLAYKSLLAQTESGPSPETAGPSNPVTSAAQTSILGQASTSANAPGATNYWPSAGTYLGANADG